MKLARLIIEDFIYPLWKNLHFLREEYIEQLASIYDYDNSFFR